MKKLGHIIIAFLALPVLTVAQSRIQASEIIAKINRSESVNYSNAVIEGDLDLTQLANKKLEKESKDSDWNKVYVSTVTAPLTFTNCTFNGAVLGYYNPDNEKNSVKAKSKVHEVFNTNFSQNVRFEGCTFEQEVAFKYSEFKGRVSFAGSRFNKDAIFKYAEFSEGPDFAKTTFEQEAVFKYVDFPSATIFSGAAFETKADFKYASFEKGSSFSDAVFTGYADFKYSKLQGTLGIEQTAFKGGKDFKYATLNGEKLPWGSF